MSAFTDTDYERVVRERDEALARVDSQRSQIAFYRTACTTRFLPEGFGDDTMRELIKELTEERDEWRDKFHALNQTAGELCNACGWAFKIPGESCRCEVIKERDEALAEVERQRELKDYLRTWLSSDELEGLRVKAAEHPLLWEEIHHLKAEVERLREMAHDFEAMREDRDGARAEVEHAYREGGALYEAKIAEREAIIERDEALAEVERLRAEVTSSLAMAKIADEKHDQKCAEADVLRGVGCMEDGDGPCGVCRECFYRHGYRRGAEAMREHIAEVAWRNAALEWFVELVRALPIPEEP